MPKPTYTWMEDIDSAIHRSLVQLKKAAGRGDINAMFSWLEALERQTACVQRMTGVVHHDHRPRPQAPLPKKEPGKLFNAQGVEINPTPLHELQAAREHYKRRWQSHLATIGVKPRGKD